MFSLSFQNILLNVWNINETTVYPKVSNGQHEGKQPIMYNIMNANVVVGLSSIEL